MKQSDADKLNAFLAEWDDSNALFNRYFDDQQDRFQLPAHHWANKMEGQQDARTDCRYG